MWIFCCGPKRSGSTLQFNIVRELVERNSAGVTLPYTFPDDFPKSYEMYKDEAGLKVFKTHDLTPFMIDLVESNKAKCISCFRDIRDVAVSVAKKENLKPNDIARSETFVGNYISYDKLVRSLPSSYISKYEEFYSDISSEAKKISKFLSLETNNEIINDIEKKHSFKNKEKLMDTSEMIDFKGRNDKKYKINRETLVHKNHFGNIHPGKYKNDLSAKSLKILEARSAMWLLRRGYKVGVSALLKNIFSS